MWRRSVIIGVWLFNFYSVVRIGYEMNIIKIGSSTLWGPKIK